MASQARREVPDALGEFSVTLAAIPIASGKSDTLDLRSETVT
ncbi:MAG: hypothetical protein ABIJ04_02760 [Bacteroidota bacterium]